MDGDEFRVLVCGGRDYSDSVRLRRVLDAVHEGVRNAEKVLVIIHGNARGADLLADQYARERDRLRFYHFLQTGQIMEDLQDQFAIN